jgi:hypothetical protein
VHAFEREHHRPRQKPVKAGIDPFNKLIDRNPKDNVKSL